MTSPPKADDPDMRHLAGTMLLAAALAFPASAQTPEALDAMASGWGRGVWAELHSQYQNPETGEFESVEGSPWSRWTVRRVGPGTVEYTTADGTTNRVQFADGVYRDFGPVGDDGSVGSPDEASIIHWQVDAEANWRIVLEWPPFPDAPVGVREFSELIVAGDLFVWTNFSGADLDSARRVMYSVSRLSK